MFIRALIVISLFGFVPTYSDEVEVELTNEAPKNLEEIMAGFDESVTSVHISWSGTIDVEILGQEGNTTFTATNVNGKDVSKTASVANSEAPLLPILYLVTKLPGVTIDLKKD